MSVVAKDEGKEKYTGRAQKNFRVVKIFQRILGYSSRYVSSYNLSKAIGYSNLRRKPNVSWTLVKDVSV